MLRRIQIVTIAGLGLAALPSWATDEPFTKAATLDSGGTGSSVLAMDVDGDGDEVNVHSTSPVDTDSDDDGVDDDVEVLSLFTSPTDPDHDGDGFCDGPGDGGGACTPGDNCPAVANGGFPTGQANSDAFPAGDACQCGDVTGDGPITADDLQRIREHLVGRTLFGPFEADRCNVAGPSDGGATDCTVVDAFVIEAVLGGVSVALSDVCDAYPGP